MLTATFKVDFAPAERDESHPAVKAGTSPRRRMDNVRRRRKKNLGFEIEQMATTPTSNWSITLYYGCVKGMIT